ncbi:MAG: Uma2 family endonuclease [Anaerolineae bacterium]
MLTIADQARSPTPLAARPAETTPRAWSPAEPFAPRWRFTVTEYHRLIAAGILHEDDRVELMGGDLVMMSPIGSKHAAAVKRLNYLLMRSLQDRALIGVQDPLYLDEHSEPQPDITVLKPRQDFYVHSHPGPNDVLLLIEVADTSIEYDRDVKLYAYARAGIVEAWLVDLIDGLIMIHREPSPTGYKLLRKALPGEMISPTAFPDLQIAVADVISE